MPERAYASPDGRRDAFGRFVSVSLLAHAAVLAGLGLTPDLAPRTVRLPAVVEVKLLATAPASRPAPKPAPKPVQEPKPIPEAAPPPPPPPPAPKPVVLPEEPKPRAVPRPEAKPKPAPRPPPPEPVREQAYEDVLASLREEAGEPVEVAEAKPLPGETAAPPSGGAGVRISAEEAAWRRRAKLHVHRAWVLAPGFRTQSLETEVRVKLGPRGHVSSMRILRSSGNPWYDESVERAIDKASPLPEPPAAGEWIFLFRPEDLFG